MTAKQGYIVGVLAALLMAGGAFSGYLYWFAGDNIPAEGTSGSRKEQSPQKAGGIYNISWSEVKGILLKGNVVAVSERHNLRVRLALKDGTIYNTKEPEIDAIIQAVKDCGVPCSGILISTE